MTPSVNNDDSRQDTFWYVLPKSESLEGPALFSKRQDCCKHSFSSSESEYHSFRVLKDAIKYLEAAVREQETASKSKDNSQEQQETPTPPRDQHSEQTAAISSYRSALREQENPSVPSLTCPLSPSSETKNNHSPPSKKRIRTNDDAATNPAPNRAQRMPPEILPHPPPPQIGIINRPSIAAISPFAPHLWHRYLGVSTILPPSSSRPDALVDDSQRTTTTSPATTRTEAAYTGMPLVIPPTPKQLKAEKRQAFENTFEQNFVRLKDFKQEFGDTDVPYSSKGVYHVGDKTIDWKKYNGLGRWCSEMRTQVKVYQAKKDVSQLSSSQTAQLRQVGFCMDPMRHLTTKPVWKDKYYQQLQAFYQEHGHSKIPSRPKTGLACWVSKLHVAHQRKQQGQPTTLTDQHIAQLNQVEFQWNLQNKSTFEETAAKWLGYNAEHGQEPPSRHPLRRWMVHTRQKYLDFQAGRPTPLTQAQVDQLTVWGFQWTSKYKIPQIFERKTFAERLQDLKEYKTKFGDTLVPQAYPGLGPWVHSMRKDYKLLLAGKNSPMTEERLEKLQQVGFHFEKLAKGPRFLKASGEFQALKTRALVKQRAEASAARKTASQKTPPEEEEEPVPITI